MVSTWLNDCAVRRRFGRSEGATQQQMIFVDVATGAERVVSLAALGGEPQGLAWLDSESLLANHSAQGGAPEQLWRLSSRDGRLSRLTNDSKFYFGSQVSPDRTTLVTMRSETRASIWVGDGAAVVDGAEVVAPAPFSGRATLATVAWVGEDLIYARYRKRPRRNRTPSRWALFVCPGSLYPTVSREGERQTVEPLCTTQPRLTVRVSGR